LPTPPAPVRVSNLAAASMVRTSAIACRLPTKLVSATGKLPKVRLVMSTAA
jgi:hypothetical protein